MYKGWGTLPLYTKHLDFLKVLPSVDYVNSRDLVSVFMEGSRECVEERGVEHRSCVELEVGKFREYLGMMDGHWQMNRFVVLNGEYKFMVCGSLMALYSRYFNYLLNSSYQKTKEILIDIPNCDPEIFHIVLGYLHTNILVIP